MTILIRSARIAPAMVIAFAVAAAAGSCYPCGTTRTYFGGPGTGPYGAPARPQNPWTGKCFGLRCCKTQEDCYQEYLKKASIAEARYQAMMNRANCPCPWGNLAGGLCAGPCACAAPGGDCGGCGKCGLFGGCQANSCGNGSGGCATCGHGGGGGYAGGGGYGGGGYGGGGAPLPGMNREDAVRYIEGFQYYPPHHLLRSPRDFYMFDVKYGIGR